MRIQQYPSFDPKTNTILHFSTGAFRIFSSFYDEAPFVAPIWLAGDLGFFWFRTREHYFQAEKGIDSPSKIYVIESQSPHMAKTRGRAIECRPDWDDIRLDVMMRAINYQFTEPKMADALLQTQEIGLQEGNTWGDDYWGRIPKPDGSWLGENHLGKLLMAKRAQLVHARETLKELREVGPTLRPSRESFTRKLSMS